MAYIERSLKNGRGNIESRGFKIYVTKINANLERFTKFLNHKHLELYGSFPIGSLLQVCTRNQAKDHFSMGIRSLAKCSQSLPQTLLYLTGLPFPSPLSNTLLHTLILTDQPSTPLPLLPHSTTQEHQKLSPG